ncbi:hypothetical protein [Fuerstiella marisgermanici]|uniref:Uncharacterized protein n=1 Tax=Fuerstiella marisgermanici TaxID=1891926 RepID=A0A1P8WN54_9PLAN|nr:hypothetical protein [Fuerstiella marisgermanici]APZ95494.1 hypothetical protein Fuma_05152 [Fuerstiella marisgermanici]
MSPIAQNVVYGSLVVAGLLGLACLIDLIMGVPFGGQTLYDILFIISAGITAYLGIDCLKEAK